MNKVNGIHSELSVTVLLYLWFEEDEIDSKDLKEFLMRWEDKLSFRTIIKQSHKLHIKDFIFFDIIPTHISNSKISKRFSYSYINSDNILGGLQEFYNVTC